MTYTEIKEEWRPVKGYEGLYEVSNLGRVKTLQRVYHCGNHHSYRMVDEHIMKPVKIKGGYLRIALSNGCKRSSHLIHRLVAEAFIQNPDNLPTINHKDCNPSNNFVDNLEWCSQQYNNRYGDRIEKVRKKTLNHPKRSKIVLQFNLEGEYINKFLSANEVQRQLGYLQSNISGCCLGKKKTAYGFIWKYA